MQIDESDEHAENEWFSIRERQEFDSKVTVERFQQPLKQ
jgi:hypothetical protein